MTNRVQPWPVMLLAAILAGCPAANPPREATSVDLSGRVMDPSAPSKAKATVLLFVDVECPISNRYAPEVRRIYERFVDRGVRFYNVYAKPTETVSRIEVHLDEFDYPMTSLRDPSHYLVKKTGATATPEAVVLDAAGEVRYRGRIDDRFIAYGKTRNAPTRHDLILALDAVMAGRPVQTATTAVVGCYIPRLR